MERSKKTDDKKHKIDSIPPNAPPPSKQHHEEKKDHQEDHHEKKHLLELKLRLSGIFAYVKSKFVRKKSLKKVTEKKTDKKKKPKRRNLSIIKDYLLQAGYEYVDERKFSRRVRNIAIIIVSILTLISIGAFFLLETPLSRIPVILITLWTLVFGVILGLIWLIIYAYLDMRIYQRTKQVEDVLPDFLQLTSANISAGMPIDQALWFSVRPKFGVLAKEIEEVAKSTIAGADLQTALVDFTKKYNSKILKRSINLIIEGMRAGGELAELLSKVAIDIQDTKLMKKEIAASVMTYVIFIAFASVAAAPVLFALSTQLLDVVQSIMGTIDLGNVSTGAFKISVSGDSIDITDFKIFSVLALSVSSIFSASIVSVIRTGSVKDGFKFIPIFLIISLTIYFIANLAVGTMMSGFI